ncbi:hypothetical protein L6452_23156 [Arctium lappa]|uniref:Uncharacterized protein n=1 Tax=Arctium lappa TaxID=4217 RepID=A0ACB9B0P1_ARCLA|nr:hypothetical protein L6452_23156 [Arctium lappa]
MLEGENNDGGVKGDEGILEEEIVEHLIGQCHLDGAENSNGSDGNITEGLVKTGSGLDLNNMKGNAGIKNTGPIQKGNKDISVQDRENISSGQGTWSNTIQKVR